jgi:hypothetical protein
MSFHQSASCWWHHRIHTSAFMTWACSRIMNRGVILMKSCKQSSVMFPSVSPLFALLLVFVTSVSLESFVAAYTMSNGIYFGHKTCSKTWSACPTSLWVLAQTCAVIQRQCLTSVHPTMVSSSYKWRCRNCRNCMWWVCLELRFKYYCTVHFPSY